MKILSPFTCALALIFLPVAVQCADSASISQTLALAIATPYQDDATQYVSNNSRENVSVSRYAANESAPSAHVAEERSWSRLWE
jgi:hypothetical protein